MECYAAGTGVRADPGMSQERPGCREAPLARRLLGSENAQRWVNRDGGRTRRDSVECKHHGSRLAQGLHTGPRAALPALAAPWPSQTSRDSHFLKTETAP